MGKKLNTKIDNTKLKILICCHKPCELPPDPDGIFLPIQVGSAISDIDLGIQRDDQVNGQSCDNISVKNKSFCELTAMYWAWKNIKKLYPDLEYIGLNHYRRYFSFDKKNLFDDVILCEEKNIKKYEIPLPVLEKNLSKKQTIVAVPRLFAYSLDINYCVNHISEDLKLLKRIIHEKYPEYDESVYTVMTIGNKLSAYNMILTRWGVFDSYCSWLFDILFEMERQKDLSCYNDYQMRIFGYLSERLLNVWLLHNQKQVLYKNIFLFCNILHTDCIYKLRNLILRVRNNFVFFLLKSKKKFSQDSYCQLNDII